MNTHGHISFLWEDDLFIASVEGAFNEEAIAYYTPLLQEAILTRKHAHWHRLEIWNSEVLGSPETIAAAKLIYDWYENNGCKRIAVVACNSLQAHVIENIFNSKAKLFSNVAKARAWLTAQKVTTDEN
ncbi:hypothetical protein GCM10009111_26920 [Colwellia asteriadis]|uniref:STAS/SEC14 domain-containing protein n=1 Tax=Colwellia asteriadis TaxID=517723 RepID=A0ABN1L9U3_9GAMM